MPKKVKEYKMKEYTFNVRMVLDEKNPPRGHYEVEIDLPHQPHVRCEMGNSIEALAEVVKNSLGNPDRTFVVYVPRIKVVGQFHFDKYFMGQFRARVYNASDFAELDKRLTDLEEKYDDLLKEVRLLEQ